jgi:rare lipoprotein A
MFKHHHRRQRWLPACLLLLVFVIAGCSSGPRPAPQRTHKAYGLASYYSKKFHGRRTASGERYNMHAMTAAHRSLPFGSTVEVTHVKNGRTVTVRINDRGPFVKGRIIDLSYAAAKKLGMLSEGVARVSVRVDRKSK